MKSKSILLFSRILFREFNKKKSYRNQSKITLLETIVGKLYNTIQDALYNANWLEILLTVWHTISKRKFILILCTLFPFVWQVNGQIWWKMEAKTDVSALL